MKPLFIMSLVCAVASLLVLFGTSVMSYVPGSDAERVGGLAVVVAGIAFVAWLGVAWWARSRREAAASSPARWLIGISVVYVLAAFALVIG